MKRILILLLLMQFEIKIYANMDLKTINNLEIKAKNGDSEAQFELGLAYEEGKFINENDGMAIAWFLKAAQQNNATAQYSLSNLYLEKHQFDDAIKWLQVLSDAGYPLATAKIAEIYEKEKKYQNAILQFKYYKLAVKQGDDDSLEKLGDLYLNGIGTEKNISLAIEFLKKASDHAVGHSTAKLGTIYYEGNGIPKNYKLAQQYYEQALIMGDYTVYGNLINLYSVGGYGIDKNQEKSKFYSEKQKDYLENQERISWGR